MKKSSGTDLERIDAMRDEDIDTSDILPLEEGFFEKATIRMPERKSSVTLRVDKEVLECFKAHGKGYQSLMNAVLKAYMKAQGEQRKAS